MGDNVSHPSHYNVGKIEVIDAIEDWCLNFSLGNAVKYIARADHKGKPIEDLEKARWYIDREIMRRMNGNGEDVRIRYHGEECRIVRNGDEFTLVGYTGIICNVCESCDNAIGQYPCDVCCHGDGDREYFKINKEKVEIIK